MSLAELLSSAITPRSEARSRDDDLDLFGRGSLFPMNGIGRSG